MKVKEKSVKFGLKLHIQKTKIMVSSPITSQQIDSEKMETVTDYIFLDSKITVGGDYTHENKTFSPWKKSYNKPRHHIKESALSKKVHIVKRVHIIFSVVMYRCENWTKKKAEGRRIDAFELCSWRRLLRGPWTARRSKKSILKEINPECSLEGLMPKL